MGWKRQNRTASFVLPCFIFNVLDGKKFISHTNSLDAVLYFGQCVFIKVINVATQFFPYKVINSACIHNFIVIKVLYMENILKLYIIN